MHICPKCGAAEGTKKFIGPFCIDCYEFRIFVPDKLELHQCKHCGRMKMRGKWMPFSEKKVTNWVESKLKGEFTSVEFSPDWKKAVFTIDRDGSRVGIEKPLSLEFIKDMCPDCNKKSGGYFETIIQLRGNDARIAKYAKLFEEMLEREGTFISKGVELKEGLDLYAGSTSSTLDVIKKLGLTYGISTTLAGQKQGKRLFRTTFAIRL